MRIAVATVDALPPGTLKKVLLGDTGEAVVVGNAEGTLFAMQNECNHGEADLSDGYLEGCEIVCPLHEGCFDIRSGKATRRPAKRPQPVFAVEVDGGTVFVIHAPTPTSDDSVGLAASA